MATEKHITMVKGDTLAFGMEFEGLEQDLSSAFFTCRQGWEGAIVFQKSLGSGIEKVEDGKYRVRVAPSDTINVTPDHYVYDLEIGANGDVFTILKGILDIEHDATH
jgi:hypothetical protein